MSGALVNSTVTADAGSGTYLLPFLPTVGNLLLAMLTSNAGIPTANTGWTSLYSDADANTFVSPGIFYRVVQIGDTATIRPASNNTATAPMAVYEFSGVASTDLTAQGQKDILNDPTMTSMTAGGNSILVVFAAARAQSGDPSLGGITYTSTTSPSSSGNRWATTGYGSVTGGSTVTPTATYTTTSSGTSKATMAVMVQIAAASTTTNPGAGSLTFTGKTPSSLITEPVGAGSLAFTGYAPTTATPIFMPVGAGSLVFTGRAPGIQVESKPGAGSLAFTGHAPTGYTSGFNRLSSFGLHAVGEVPSALRTTSMGLHSVAQDAPTLRGSALGLLSVAQNLTRTRISSMGLLVLAKGGTPPVLPQPLSLAASGRTKVINSRIVNMYYETTPDGPAPDARFGRPGLASAAERGGGPITANFDWQGFNFTVSGDTVWRDNENIGTVMAGPDTRFATSDNEIVIVTGGRSYYVTTEDVVQMADIDIPDPVIDVILRTNGRFIYLSDKGQWYWSDVGDARSIDPLSFATADQAPDNLMAAINVNDSFVLFGTASGEWWYDTGDNNAPFQRSQGRAYRKGLAARQTLVEADNSGYFLGSDRVVYRMGADPIRVSTYDVEDKIRRVPQAYLPNAWAFSTTFGGHTWYVLSLPGQGTWALDISQNKWQEWKSWDKANFRVRVANGPVLGDQYTGKIMSFDQQAYTDLGDPLERIVGVYLPLKAGQAKNFNLMLATLRGVGLPSGYGSAPVVEMHYSDTDGRTWSNWMEAPLAAMGDFQTKAIWDQLGALTAPGRLYEFRVTDPVEFTPYAVKYNELRP